MDGDGVQMEIDPSPPRDGPGVSLSIRIHSCLPSADATRGERKGHQCDLLNWMTEVAMVNIMQIREGTHI